MATITIKYTAPVAPAEQQVADIAPMFKLGDSYIDTDAYDGTVYDTNVKGFGTWEGLVSWIESITMHPGILILFKAAVRDGSATTEETDTKIVEYFKEIGSALKDAGFTVEVA